MNDAPRKRLHVETVNRVDAICDRFEEGFRSGSSPRIEEYLAEALPADRPRLLAELVPLELALRRESGDAPRLADYAARFPDDMTAIEQAFADLQPSLSTVPSPLPGGATPLPPGSIEPSLVGGSFPRQLGKFDLLDELGRGGMGVVYKAHDRTLNRTVALKLITAGHLASSEAVRRFQQEAELAAQLRHPNIVPVYETGEFGGQHYLAMGFIDGTSLAHHLRQFPPTSDEAARLLRMISNAVAYAHERGIIHRDLKPANVLLDREGEPHVADFGLARRLDVDSGLSKEGDIVGTPSFLPPEQATGRRKELTIRSDVYALGGVLYQLLTGRPPFVGESVMDTLLLVCQKDPEPPRRTHPEVPRDLEAICLKCLEKTPERRYESCLALSDDLQRFLESRPTRARPLSPAGRLGRWCLRNRLASTAIALTVLVAAGLVVHRQTRPAYLDVRVSPADATVTLGNETLPLADGEGIVPVRPGRDVLRIEADGYESEQRELVLVRGRESAHRLSVELRPKFGYLLFQTEPAGAAVEVLDAAGAVVAQGATPFHSSRLPTGDYTLRVARDLYRPHEQKVAVPNGDRVADVPAVKLTPAVEGTESLAQLERTRAAMGRPLSRPYQFNKTPLNQVISQISEGEKASIILDSTALDEAGVATNRPITLGISGLSLDRALRLVLDPIGLTTIPDADAANRLSIRVTSQQRSSRILRTVVFPVGDILRARPRSRAGDLTGEVMSNSRGPWRELDGDGGTIALQVDAGALTVTQTYAVQADVIAYLTELRRTIASNPMSSSHELAAAVGIANAERLTPEAQAALWMDTPLSVDWPALPDAIRESIVSGQGIVHERYLVVPDLALDELTRLRDALRQSRYRPLRIRPHRNGTKVLTASVWTRDAVDYEWVSGISATELARKHGEMQSLGWRALDVAGWTGESDQFSAVWAKVDVADRTMELGLDDRTNGQRFEQRKSEGLTPRIQHIFYDGSGRFRVSMLWVRPEPANLRWGCWMGTRATYESKWSQYQAQSDVTIATHPQRGSVLFGGCFFDEPGFDHERRFGESLEDHRKRADDLVGQGFRPIAIDSAALQGETLVASLWRRPQKKNPTVAPP